MKQVFWRYWAFQVPGLIGAGAVAWILHYFCWISTRTAIWIWGFWLVKDMVLFPFLVESYRIDRRSALERLVGMKGTTKEALQPDGYVGIRGELWRARAWDFQPIPRGTRVKAIAAQEEERLLIVQVLEESEPDEESEAEV